MSKDKKRKSTSLEVFLEGLFVVLCSLISIGFIVLCVKFPIPVCFPIIFPIGFILWITYAIKSHSRQAEEYTRLAEEERKTGNIFGFDSAVEPAKIYWGGK